MKSDQERWDKRWKLHKDAFPEPDPFLVEHVHLLSPGRALDLACGLGANALFLAEHGFVVDALDISFPALRTLQAEAARRRLVVNCAVVDLDYFPLPRRFYEVVLVFAFYATSLIAPIKAALKPGGFVVYATFNSRHRSVKPDFNPKYLIEPEGLARNFAEYAICVHESDAGEERNVSRIVARKPPGASF